MKNGFERHGIAFLCIVLEWTKPHTKKVVRLALQLNLAVADLHYFHILLILK